VVAGDAKLSFDAHNAAVVLDGHQVCGYIVTAPTATANAVAVYHNAQGSGGTGVYVKSATVEDELISKTKAIAFGLIL
jgi:hypothetical protein